MWFWLARAAVEWSSSVRPSLRRPNPEARVYRRARANARRDRGRDQRPGSQPASALAYGLKDEERAEKAFADLPPDVRAWAFRDIPFIHGPRPRIESTSTNSGRASGRWT